jgi:hypothetical protein
MELKSVLLKKFTQFLVELAAEHLAECLDGQEELARRVQPCGAIECKVAGGNDVVYVGVNLKDLPPGMEHAEKSDVCFQVLGIANKFEQRSGAGAEEQIVK